MTALALLVVPTIVLEEALADDSPLLSLTEYLDWFIWLGFAFCLIGIFALRPRRSFFRDYAFDILLVVATPPMAPAAWQALRVLRTLRILRLALAGRRLHRQARAFKRASIVGPAGIVMTVIVVAAAAAVRAIEPESVPSAGAALWWATARATAMGDGGVALRTAEAHALELIVALCGLAFLSLITAAVASIFVRAQRHVDPSSERLDAVLERLERLEERIDMWAHQRGGS